MRRERAHRSVQLDDVPAGLGTAVLGDVRSGGSVCVSFDVRQIVTTGLASDVEQAGRAREGDAAFNILASAQQPACGR